MEAAVTERSPVAVVGRISGNLGWRGPSSRGQDAGEQPLTGVFFLIKAAAGVGLAIMVLLPLLEAGLRLVRGSTVVNSAGWIQHLTLWVGLGGGVLASVQGRHFSVAINHVFAEDRVTAFVGSVTRGSAAGILILLVAGAPGLLVPLWSFPSSIGDWLPVSLAMAPIPIAFSLMALVTVARPGESWGTRGVTVAVAAFVAVGVPTLFPDNGRWPLVLGIGGLVSLALAGMPLFTALCGSALLLFFRAGMDGAVVLNATYEIATKSVLPSVPLFAMAGVVLARGGGPARLVRLVQGWLGWMPGGASIATILGCAFFTAITGASGVTILALGALLMPVLLSAKHKEPFSLGLLTASGSAGLLFPPSLPVIICAVYGGIGLDLLFLAALLPGILLLLVLGAFSFLRSPGEKSGLTSFDMREALSATRAAWGDLLLPVLILLAFYGGVMAPVETAALAALWAVVLEVGIHRTMKPGGDLTGAMTETAILVGALIVVIGFSQGLFGAFVDAQIPARAAEWIPGVIGSKWVFLLVLNLMLLLVGAFMDIYSAIVVVMPLLLPLARAYGIHPGHLAVVFLTNMELGYLTPPVGMNLFLSSLTFKRPLLEVWRAVLPFFGILGLWVLLVTFVPFISVGFAEWVLR